MSDTKPVVKREVKDAVLLKQDNFNRFNNVYSKFLLMFSLTIMVSLLGTSQTALLSEISPTIDLIVHLFF